MNKEEIILRGIDEIPMFTFNTKTKEFSVLGHKFEGVNSIEDFINYIYDLGKENKELKEKVNQLEKNIDEAIEYINKLEFEEYGVLYDNGTSIMEYEDNCKETLLEILEGGKE